MLALKFHMHFARRACVPACADASVKVPYALRARGMRPCARGFPKFRFYTHCVRGKGVPACAVPEVYVLYPLLARGMRSCVRGFRRSGCVFAGFVRTARAGNASMRARAPKFMFYTHCARGASVPACADANVKVRYVLGARGMRSCARGG